MGRHSNRQQQQTEPTNAASNAPAEESAVTSAAPSSAPPTEIGLGDFLGDGLDTAERHTEDELPPTPPTPTVVTKKPAAAADLREGRVTYRAKPAAKCGPTVTSLTKADRADRTRHSDIYVVCPEHHTKCYSGTSEGIFTRYYCSVEGCTFSHKLVSPTVADKINEARRRNEQLPHPQQDIQAR